jgi:hypothetical protein
MSDVIEAPVVETPVTAEVTPPETATPPEKEATPDKPEKTFSQADLDKIVQKRLAQESRRIERAARAEAENALLREQMQRQAPKPQESGEPKRDDFQSWDEWNEARVEWKANAVVEQRLKAERENYQRLEAERSQAEFKRQASQRLNEGHTKYDDFAEVALSEEVPVTEVMADAIADSEKAVDIAYWLGKNLAEAKRIASLNPASQAREIGKIEARLESPPKTTSAPPPLKSVGSGSASKSADQMSTEEWMAWRNKQLKKGK